MYHTHVKNLNWWCTTIGLTYQNFTFTDNHYCFSCLKLNYYNIIGELKEILKSQNCKNINVVNSFGDSWILQKMLYFVGLLAHQRLNLVVNFLIRFCYEGSTQDFSLCLTLVLGKKQSTCTLLNGQHSSVLQLFLLSNLVWTRPDH